MNKQISLDEVKNHIKSGMTIMVGGFLGVGTPEKLIDILIDNNINDITLICTDTAFPEVGSGRLIVNKLVKKVIASHIGTNPETGRQMIEKEIDVELVPQGSLAERIRCGGFGLGGVLTKTGVGTLVEETKQIVTLNDEKYIIEPALHADVALILASVADEKGNLTFEASTKNFNTLMAMAADTVIVQAENIVPVGDIAPDNVVTPHIVVDYIVKGE